MAMRSEYHVGTADGGKVDLSKFDGGPFTWDAERRVIRDAKGTIRCGLLVIIPPDKGEELTERWNHYHSLRLLTKPDDKLEVTAQPLRLPPRQFRK